MFGRRRQVGLVLLLVVAPLGPLAVIEEAPPRAPSADSAVEERLRELVSRQDRVGAGAPSTDRQVVVVLKLKRGAALAEEVDPDRLFTREGATLLRTRVSMSQVRALGRAAGVQAVHIRRNWTTSDGRVAAGVAAVGADALHRRGLTGSNVTVGIIGSGFRPDDPAIARNVGAYRTFDTETNRWRHGTAVTSVVVDTAPDAEVHLASVGGATTPEEYAEAVAWLRSNDVDVILDAGSYFGQPGDGSGRIARIAQRAARETLFVTTAGNYGRRHWSGQNLAMGGPGWVQFAEDDEANYLSGGDRITGRVRVSLQWADWPTDDDYDLYLMRQQFGKDEPVAVSERRQNGSDPVEHIATTVPQGRYYVSIQVDDARGTHRLELFANRRLEHRSPAGSLTAPATASNVFVVGAMENGSLAPYSSRGPVDGRRGVDVVAPASVALRNLDGDEGTSYAAPYAAGVAALVYQRYDLSPAATAAVLGKSATDVGEPGVDPAAGYGRLNAVAAYRLAGTWHRHHPVAAAA